MSLQNSHQISEVKVLLKKGADGTGIVDIELTGQSLNVDTYTITLTNGDKYTFTVTNGSSIASIEKTSTVGNVDTYTITLTNGDTSTFEVTNGTGSTASDIDYDNSTSGASATKVQGAIDEAFSDIKTLDDEKLDQSIIAPVEDSTTASQAYATGQQFMMNGLLYEATTDIASGATITVNGNCVLSPNIVEQIGHGVYELWKNNNLSSSMASGDIGAVSSDKNFDTFIIEYKRSTSHDVYAVSMSELNVSNTLSFFTIWSSNAMHEYSRNITISKSGNTYTFNVGGGKDYKMATWGNVQTVNDDSVMIISRILGIVHND